MHSVFMCQAFQAHCSLLCIGWKGESVEESKCTLAHRNIAKLACEQSLLGSHAGVGKLQKSERLLFRGFAACFLCSTARA